jgi:2-oxoglutarate dehydrogenase E1 component
MPAGDVTGLSRDLQNVYNLIRAYRVRGHLHAKIDPLNLYERPVSGELLPETHGFSEADMGKSFYLEEGLFGRNGQYGWHTLAEVVSKLKETYCSSIGVEYYHIWSGYEREWVRARVEGDKYEMPKEYKVDTLGHLMDAYEFESFLATKWGGAKRFGVEGGEALIPCLEMMLTAAADAGIRSVVMGMPHRGRLNVLANVFNKPAEHIFAEFHGRAPESPDNVEGSGDVKYHLGTSIDREIHGHKVHLSLASNPSHLEAVNPVVVGKTRAKQFFDKDFERKRTMSVLMHGDAAFAGQGVNAETLEMSMLESYTSGGTIHVVVNNQIGYFTNQLLMYCRFSRCTCLPVSVPPRPR